MIAKKYGTLRLKQHSAENCLLTKVHKMLWGPRRVWGLDYFSSEHLINEIIFSKTRRQVGGLGGWWIGRASPVSMSCCDLDSNSQWTNHALRLIYRPRRDGRLSWPGWLTHADTIPTKWSQVNHRSGVDQGSPPAKDRRPLNHWTTPPARAVSDVYN